jgi:hypothetical protein
LGFGIKNQCAVEGQQQFSSQSSKDEQVDFVDDDMMYLLRCGNFKFRKAMKNNSVALPLQTPTSSTSEIYAHVN